MAYVFQSVRLIRLFHDSHSHKKAPSATKITQWCCPNCGQLFFNTSEFALPLKCGNCRTNIEWEELGDHPRRWRCPNCGQILFTAPRDEPPDMCHYCRDFTTWIRIYE